MSESASSAWNAVSIGFHGLSLITFIATDGRPNLFHNLQLSSPFLADRTYCRAYGTSLCQSFVRMSVFWLNVKSWGVGNGTVGQGVTSSYMLSIVTMSLSAAVWPRFSTQSCCLHISLTCTQLPQHIVDCRAH